jgi:hypothetical protein
VLPMSFLYVIIDVIFICMTFSLGAERFQYACFERCSRTNFSSFKKVRINHS